MALFGLLRDANGPPGLDGGRLRRCEIDANCVCTEHDDDAAPLAYGSRSPAAARDALAAILETVPRLRVVESRPEYVHAIVRSRLFRFADDLEFRFDDAAGAIHMRSASRLGRDDLGVNRKRLAELRDRWAATA